MKLHAILNDFLLVWLQILLRYRHKKTSERRFFVVIFLKIIPYWQENLVQVLVLDV